MSEKEKRLASSPESRRVSEEEYLLGEATDTLEALLESLGLSQQELSRRLRVSEGRVSQILSGSENLTLRSLAALGWALGLRFELKPVPMSDRSGTPALNDPPAPAWLEQLNRDARVVFTELAMPSAGGLTLGRPKVTVLPKGELREAA